MFAYELREQQLVGVPGWAKADRYDVIGKPSAPVPVGPSGDAQLRKMLQALLAERFGFTFHREIRELPAYALVIAKRGSRLTLADPDVKGPNIDVRKGQIIAVGISMDLLAQSLSNEVGRPVVNVTGLTGRYTFKLDFIPEVLQTIPLSPDAGLPDVTGSTLVTALQEQLGLRIESHRTKVEVIVLDMITRPTAN
jgi:uncharacterized protein (TIGR03435 family)